MKQVYILFSNTIITRFMQDADIFEKFKVLLAPQLVADVIDDFGDSNIEAIIKQCEIEGNYSLVAIYDAFRVYYRNPDVKVVSWGTHWSLLNDLLPEHKEIT